MNRWVVGIPVLIFLVASVTAVPADDEVVVKDKKNAVKKDEKIDYEDEEIIAPGEFEITGEGENQKLRIRSKLLKPSKKDHNGWYSKRFFAFRDATFSDIWTGPEGSDPLRIKDEMFLVQVENTCNLNQIDDFPLRAEGNIKSLVGGPGGGAEKLRHWSMKSDAPDIDLDIDSNNDGSIDGDDNGEDKYEEALPGAILAIDCRGDGEDADDHLTRINLSIDKLPANYRFALRKAGGKGDIKVWDKEGKSRTLPIIFKEINESQTGHFYVDGTKVGDVILAANIEEKGPTTHVAHSDKVRITVTQPISWAPGPSTITIWAPLVNIVENKYKKYAYGHAGPDTFNETLANEENNQYYYGWETHWYIRQEGNKPNRDLTLANFRNMAEGGIVIPNAHGNAGIFGAVYFVGEGEDPDADANERATAWMGNEENMRVEENPQPDNPLKPYHHFVVVDASWFADHWQEHNDAHKAIVWWMACHSAEGKNSLMGAGGGRVRLGCEGVTTDPRNCYEAKKLLVDLLGRKLNKRRFGGAYDNQVKKKVRVRGIKFIRKGDAWVRKRVNPWHKLVCSGVDDRWKWTTLHPAPRKTYPQNHLAKDNTKAGAIVFDTYMNGADGEAANDAVVVYEGETVNGRYWFAPSNPLADPPITYEPFGIGFVFTKKSNRIITRAVGQQCRHAISNGGDSRGMVGDFTGEPPYEYESDRDWSW